MHNIYQFSNQVISKEWLLNQGLKLLYIDDNFIVDNDIVALFDIKDQGLVYGNSLVVHDTRGVFIVERTTKQLMNEFHQSNRVGFMVSRILSSYFKFKHFLPLVHGNVGYMPLTGGSRSNADWIGLHYVAGFSQADQIAKFESTQGFNMEFDFPKGNLSTRVHDVSVMAEYFVSSARIYLRSMNLKVTVANSGSILTAFSTCICPSHQKIPRKYQEVEQGVDHLVDSVFLKMCRGELGYRETVIIYKQKISKTKRNY